MSSSNSSSSSSNSDKSLPSDFPPPPNNPPPPPKLTLHIHVIDGAHLPSGDNRVEAKIGKKKISTKAKEGEAPKWNEKLQFDDVGKQKKKSTLLFLYVLA